MKVGVRPITSSSSNNNNLGLVVLLLLGPNSRIPNFSTSQADYPLGRMCGGRRRRRRRVEVASSSFALGGVNSDRDVIRIQSSAPTLINSNHLLFGFGIPNKMMTEEAEAEELFLCCALSTPSAVAAESEAVAEPEPKPIANACSLMDQGQPTQNADKREIIVDGDLKKQQKKKQQQQQQHHDDDVLELPSGLRKELLPKHVAIIMDGNSRWAASRGLPTCAGHKAGYTSLKNIITLSCKWGIRALTVFAFSHDNWHRPTTEVDFLMMLFQNVLKENLMELFREGIRVCIIGDLSKLPRSLQKLAKEVEENTSSNSRLDLVVAISYSGRNDIVQACRRIAQMVKQGLLEPAEVTESLIAQELETNRVVSYNYPDLLIRTSGELRLSNFLLWESAYTELYFAKVHWPDFGEADYIEALSSFQMRQRRFGQRTI